MNKSSNTSQELAEKAERAALELLRLAQQSKQAEQRKLAGQRERRGQKPKDFTNQRFGKLVARYLDPSSLNSYIKWICVCDCGNATVTARGHLVRNNNPSCGCASLINVIKSNTRHGFAKTATYDAWSNMKKRCYNPNDIEYKWYGGRGISVHPRWKDSFKNFLKDMGERPSKLHSIDRINNDGNYEPGNCRWATRKEQSRNRTDNHWIEFNGQRKILQDWADEIGIPRYTIFGRLKRGMSVEKALTPRFFRQKKK